jgi:hypothetical protein
MSWLLRDAGRRSEVKKWRSGKRSGEGEVEKEKVRWNVRGRRE